GVQTCALPISRSVCGRGRACDSRSTDAGSKWVQGSLDQKDHCAGTERSRRCGMSAFQGLNRDRFDGKLKVTGRAMYAGDHDFPNLAFGFLIQSSISRGQIRAFDLGAALESPGVIAIFTPFNSLKLYRPLGREEGVISGDVIPLLQATQGH